MEYIDHRGVTIAYNPISKFYSVHIISGSWNSKTKLKKRSDRLQDIKDAINGYLDN